jgi:hypothetical protein
MVVHLGSILWVIDSRLLAILQARRWDFSKGSGPADSLPEAGRHRRYGRGLSNEGLNFFLGGV